MTVVLCTNCGEEIAVRSRFEVGGICPECGEDDCLVEEDAYDPGTRELRCAECRWQVEAGVRLEWGGSTRAFSVDDDCPVCSAAGLPDRRLSRRTLCERHGMRRNTRLREQRPGGFVWKSSAQQSLWTLTASHEPWA